MIDFARRWHYFGGGTREEIFVNFGVTPSIFYKRLTRVLHTSQHSLDTETRTNLLRLSEKRLIAEAEAAREVGSPAVGRAR